MIAHWTAAKTAQIFLQTVLSIREARSDALAHHPNASQTKNVSVVDMKEWLQLSERTSHTIMGRTNFAAEARTMLGQR